MSQLRFASLGSGSKGNATLVEAGSTCVMLDCGFSLAETERRLEQLECSPESISAIMVTHEHGDHSAGVGKFSRKYDLPVWLTVGTFHACKDNQFASLHYIDSHSAFRIQDLYIQPFPVPHDAREPCQFVFSNTKHRLAVLTDTGSVTPCILEHLDGVDALLLEFNYDEEMLRKGAYPPRLKQRVSGSHGHLDNQQSRQILERVDTGQLQHLIAMHVSEKNNHESHVLDVLSSEELINKSAKNINIEIASQENGFFWKKIL